MFSFFSVAIAILAFVSAQGNDELERPMIGFGKQRILNFNTRGVLHKKVGASYTCDNITENWFTGAVLDNFAPVEQQKAWVGKGQRYFVNKEFWGGNNYPIFVFIGGEGEEKCTRLTSYMYMYDLAKEHRAMLVDVEHRFYGQSIPTVDTSTPNLAYLSSSQALADLARVISHVKKSYDTVHSKVITVGGSYPGNLAAWFRLKYPQISHGSIASSAPVMAQTNFPEYMDVVGQAIIHFSGQQCFTAMQLAAEVVASLGSIQGGMKRLETDFQLCSPMQSELDLSILLSDLMGNVQGTVQYNNEHAGVMNVTNICAIMTTGGCASTDADAAYANFVQLQKAYREANGQTCEDGNWDDTMAALSQTGAGRSWTYQTCNEFGYYQTTDSTVSAFCLPLSCFTRFLRVSAFSPSVFLCRINHSTAGHY
jgi:hypothetical protein